MPPTYPYFQRELSWLSFNQRVLLEAADSTLPLYDRIHFLAIFSSNLDEFVRVKVAGLQNLLLLKASQLEKYDEDDPTELLQQIAAVNLIQQEAFGRIFTTHIQPELLANGINLYQGQPLLEAHVPEVRHYFRTQVLAFLQPVFLSHTTNPFLIDRRLYLTVRLRNQATPEAGYTYAYVNIPSDQLRRSTVTILLYPLMK